MKVIHLIGGGDEGGAKSHVLQLIKELGKHIEVTLISFRKGQFHDEAVEMGLNAQIIRTGNIILDLRETLKVVKSGHFDIIHCHGAKANMMASIIKRMTGIPAVTTVHSDYRLDYMHSLLKRFSFGIINMVALRRIDYHISVSNNFKEMLIERGFNPQRIYSVYNGIPFDNAIEPCTRKEFFERFKVPFPEDCVLIGILARLHPVKDHETFLKAAAEVVKVNPLARFLISGPGDELLPHLKQFTEKLGLTSYVYFSGMVDRPFDFFQSIDVNVLTSISESFPYVILEGARFAKVTVSTRVGGLGDLIESGVNGYLVQPKDWRTLGDHLTELSLNKEKREQMGALLREKAEREFSLKNMCKTQLSIYEAVLKTEAAVRVDGKKYDIALLGYYGYKNSGDEAILRSTLNAFRKLNPDLTTLVFSKDPRETKRTYHVDSVNRFNFLKVMNRLKKTRLFLAGGGSLIQDNTSTRSILYYLSILKMAKRAGTRTMLFANGIGPIKRNFNRRYAGKILNDLHAISLRDSGSYQEIKALGISKPNIYVTSDPAILMEPSDNTSIHALMAKEHIPQDKPLIGFSIRKWADTNYLDSIAKIADYCVNHFGAHPVFIPMQYPADYEISQSIRTRMVHASSIIEGMYRPEVLLGFTGKLELLVGMRLHSLIYGASQCIPLIGLVYEPKVCAFLTEIEQPSAGNLDKLDRDKFCQILNDVWENKAQIKENLTKTKERLKIMAQSNIEIAYYMSKGSQGDGSHDSLKRSHENRPLDSIAIHGVLIDNVTMDEALERVIGMLKEDKAQKVYTPNSEIIMKAYRENELKHLLNDANLLVADGAGVILASKILGRKLKQKVSGFDLVKRIFMNTDRRATSFFIFGGKPGVSEQASINILSEFPRANILGFRNGYFRDEDVPDIIRQINAAKAEILLVGLGAPRQEMWIHEHAHELNCKVIMGIGGSIDVFAGTASLAPEFMRKAGFEWLYRLFKEPSRYKRMMDLPRFMILTIKTRFKKSETL